jgi:hypothetical protein
MSQTDHHLARVRRSAIRRYRPAGDESLAHRILACHVNFVDTDYLMDRSGKECANSATSKEGTW